MEKKGEDEQIRTRKENQNNSVVIQLKMGDDMEPKQEQKGWIPVPAEKAWSAYIPNLSTIGKFLELI